MTSERILTYEVNAKTLKISVLVFFSFIGTRGAIVPDLVGAVILPKFQSVVKV